ncbi:MAG TPA: hypothetical protein VKP52_00575, partial [Pseudolabrys sp.]|nr:hypothetical protein [Pseudolabrys sp.]
MRGLLSVAVSSLGRLTWTPPQNPAFQQKRTSVHPICSHITIRHPLAGEMIDFFVRQLEKVVEQAELVHACRPTAEFIALMPQ